MDVKKCDKCGKIFDKNERGSGYLDLHLVGGVKHADICEACAKDIVEYLFKPMSEVDRWREVYDQVVATWAKKYAAGRENNEKCSCETKVKAPMLRFMLDGCDISYAAEAPADMTLAQLLKQCDRIHPAYCACGIRSTDDEPELIFGYDSVDYVRGETGYAECSIDGVNEPTCEHCRYLRDAESKGWIGKCGNKNSSFYNCLRDTYNTCEWHEDKND